MSHEIERIRQFRHRLHSGGTLTVTEVHQLLDEVEQVHAAREAVIHTNIQLREQLNQARRSLGEDVPY